uniref:Uncharacterized protein n=1 Tax=Meloidogyne enterolobii TaxID=390850 RepID=A0A6V7VX16_MELEN|nr:unnamed protein product [Meloidogyne enterolobii]
MRTPNQLEEWSFSANNSDNIKNKIEDETLVEEEENLTETSSIDGLSTTCGSCCPSKNIIKELKQHLKELELKLKNNNLYLENNNLKMQMKIQKINSDHKNEIEEIKQKFQKLIEENIQKLNAENDIYLKQKDDKIKALEKEIKETLQKINSEYEKEIKNLKQNFQQLIEENNKQLKAENDRKDGKINSLEEEIKKANGLFEKQIGDLSIKLNNVILNNFVKIKNKWKEISDSEYYQCCDNKCINTNKPIGSDNCFAVFAENAFKKPQNCFNYTFYYFEIKCKCERELSKGLDWMNISLKSCSTNKHINFAAEYSSIYNEKRESFKLPTFSWNNNDIFGCGLVYPPSNKMNYKFPYVFFTQNGKQIGKGMLLKDNHDSYKPCVWLQCCSVETNFGNDLESKPFKYDVSKHFILKEFY